MNNFIKVENVEKLLNEVLINLYKMAYWNEPVGVGNNIAFRYFNDLQPLITRTKELITQNNKFFEKYNGHTINNEKETV